MTLKSDAMFEEKLTLGSKNDIWSLMRAVAGLKICIMVAYFCRNYVMIQLKKDR